MNPTTFDPPYSLALLARTPGVVDALLRGLPEEWLRLDEGPDTWTPAGVVAHLVHVEETNWIPRVRTLLEHGTGRAFPPFDIRGHLERYPDPDLDTLLDAFARLRAESLVALDRTDLSPETLERRGVHPALGEVTLSQLLCTWTVHDLTHLNQIQRVLAKGYREAVGPWIVNLSILRDRDSSTTG